MANIASIATDLDSAEKGRWFTWFEDCRLLIASTQSPAYRAGLKKISTAGRNGFRPNSDAADAQFEREHNKLLAKTILLGWENFEMHDELVPYSYDKALEYLDDPRFGPLRDFVLVKAQEVGEFTEAALEEAEGN